MADHAHQRILEAVQSVLVAASTAAGANVFLDRVDELPATSLPAIDILGADDTGEDSIEVLTIGSPPMLQHAYSFPISCVCAQKDGAAKAARNLAKQVEAALLAASNAIVVGGKSILLVSDGSAEIKDGAGAVSMFAVRQQWQAQYQTQGGAPDVPL
jgi:hypothetical protein